MAGFLGALRSWFGGGSTDNVGVQTPVPGTSIFPATRAVSEDAALQISAVWACIDRRATAVASLPLFVYKNDNGNRTLARDSNLWTLLHESPNRRMTPFDFWRTMIMNHDLHGAGYARIDRNDAGEAMALWPMHAPQVTPITLPNGSMVYEYRSGSDVMVLADSSVLPIKGLGNGTTGLNKLSYMQASAAETANAGQHASLMFANGGKPSGILMLDHVLNKEQREAVREKFSGLATGSTASFHLLEANMEYKQLSISPQDLQLLETRRFGITEICRWFDVPPVLIHHDNVTTWGSGIYEIKDGFHTLAMRPLTINIEQAIRKHVLTPKQRATLTAEFSYDAILRGDPDKRSQIIARQVQNGLKTRNEGRQLENDPPLEGGDVLTVQSNMLPIDKLGTVTASGGSGSTIAQ